MLAVFSLTHGAAHISLLFMTLSISRGSVQVMLQHALENQPMPVCGLLAGGKDYIDYAQALTRTTISSRKCSLDALELRQILADWERRGLTFTGVYFVAESLSSVSILEKLSGVSVNRLWQVVIDMDTKGRLDMHAFLGVGRSGEEVPMELCEEGEMQTLYPARACD